MEGEEGASFEFDVDRLVNGHSAPVSPSPVEIPSNLSNELGELGSSSGSNPPPPMNEAIPKQKLMTVAASTNESNRKMAVAAGAGSSSFHPPLMGTWKGIGVVPGISPSPWINQNQPFTPWTSLRYQDYLINQRQLQPHQVPGMTNVNDPSYQQNYSMLHGASIDSRLPQFGYHNGKTNEGLDISPYCNSLPSTSRFQQHIHPANLFDLQLQCCNSWQQQESLKLSGAQICQPEELANQNARRITDLETSQQTQLFNTSETLQANMNLDYKLL
ncbi:uncharacterized protein LOC131174659 [Hevea brasiliensis]|uniref:uncharacterized protein LOC131174659 n=1 Tax=Hevea brasiliensis TaxID=3981 RepID=UPI0025E4560A|nr:uncharacterized protein LOC131174659 [Hevea brasiliensis]